MVEEEAHQIEEGASQEATDVEMVDPEESGHLESSDSHVEVTTEDNPSSRGHWKHRYP